MKKWTMVFNRQCPEWDELASPILCDEVGGDPLAQTVDHPGKADLPRLRNVQMASVAPEAVASIVALIDIIHDDLPHARQKDHADTLDAARAVLRKSGMVL